MEKIKRMLRRLDNRLELVLTAIFRRTQRRHPYIQSDFEAYELRQKLEEKQRDINYLQFQLVKARADKTDLHLRRNELVNVFAQVLDRTDDQLRCSQALPVRPDQSGTGWEVVTQRCCLGGCDIGVYSFQSERDARRFAALLEAIEYRPSHNIACSACYTEYQKDCI